jgi:hypothetical protein
MDEVLHPLTKPLFSKTTICIDSRAFMGQSFHPQTPLSVVLLLNLGMGSRLIIVAVHVRAVKIARSGGREGKDNMNLVYHQN